MEWIKCSERMPEPGKGVLAWFANGNYPIWAAHYGPEWCASLGMCERYYHKYEITHWMPVVRPPQ